MNQVRELRVHVFAALTVSSLALLGSMSAASAQDAGLGEKVFL
jgi:hypothetical protein